MESIDHPQPAPPTAQQALADIDTATRAVRNTPWPNWLYAANAALLGAMALTGLLGEQQSIGLMAVAIAIVALNMTVGYRIGIPWTLPASRGFLASVVVAGACIVASVIVAELSGQAWLIIVLAVGATCSYLLGSVAHHRSTAR